MSETTTDAGTQTTTDQQQEGADKTFSQSDVDRIVKDRLDQQARNKFGDYADLKAKAEGARTVEQQLADLVTKQAETETRALRSEVAARYGISTRKGPNGEPSDADLFLTGSDETSLEAQAKRLGERVSDQKKNGNRAPREGRPVTTNLSPKDAAKREWLAGIRGDEA